MSDIDRQALAVMVKLPDDWDGWDACEVGEQQGAQGGRFQPTKEEALAVALADHYQGDTYRRNVRKLIDGWRVVLIDGDYQVGGFGDAAPVVQIVVADDAGRYLHAEWRQGVSKKGFILTAEWVGLWQAGMEEERGWSSSSAMFKSWLNDAHDDPNSQVQRCLAWDDGDE